MTFRRLPMALMVALAIASTAGHAADAVTDAIQAAYVPYRAALFRTNSKAQEESERAMKEAQARWQGVVDRHAASPAAPYDRDSGFAATLREVAAVYAKADALVQARQLPEAHEVLERVRDLLTDLRRRNNVVVFSDHMNDYHEAMEHMLIDGAKLVDDPQGMPRLMAQHGVLEYLARRLETRAPQALASDPAFTAARKGVAESVAALGAALATPDKAAIRKAISALKPPYSKLFMAYG